MNRMSLGTFLYTIFVVLMIFLTGVVSGWRLREYAGGFVAQTQIIEVRIIPADDVPPATPF